jgi:hypothetical protein
MHFPNLKLHIMTASGILANFMQNLTPFWEGGDTNKLPHKHFLHRRSTQHAM